MRLLVTRVERHDGAEWIPVRGLKVEIKGSLDIRQAQQLVVNDQRIPPPWRVTMPNGDVVQEP